MKKIVAILLTLIMVIGCSTTVFATSREEDKQKTTTVKIDKNTVSSDKKSRNIKISWDDVNGADSYKIEIANNEYFENSITKKRLPKQGLYWTFAELPGEIDDTYYIRVKPCFVYGVLEDGTYDYEYGQWNMVVAEYSELEVEKNDYRPNYSFIKIDLSKIDFSHLLKNVNWNNIIPKYDIPTLKILE